jgi:hypothetical protein
MVKFRAHLDQGTGSFFCNVFYIGRGIGSIDQRMVEVVR